MNTLKTTIAIALTIIIGLALYSQPSYAEEFTISLKQGENLISIPLQPQNTAIEAVLSSIAGNYTDVWTHNAGDAIDPWKHYNPDYAGYNDLTTIEHGKGYRLFTNKDCVLKVTGTTPSAQTYPLTLHQGWNLIGWPFTNEKSIANALSNLKFGIDYDQVSTIEPGTGKQLDYYGNPVVNAFDNFKPGKGYYIYCLKDNVTAIIDSTPDSPATPLLTSTYWVDASSYRSFEEAIAAIGTQEKTLLIPKALDISKNITIPNNINLHFEKGGRLTIPAGVTVTINGGVDAGLFQIFKYTETGTGKVTFGQGAVKELYPQWWGAKGDGKTDDTKAIQATIDAACALHGTVFIPAGVYRAYLRVEASGVSIIGAGSAVTTIKLPDNASYTVTHENGNEYTGAPIVLDLGNCAQGNAATAYSKCVVKGLTLDGNRKNITTPTVDIFNIGLAMTKMSDCFIEDIRVINCYNAGFGVFIDSNHNRINGIHIENCSNTTIGSTFGFQINASKHNSCTGIDIEDCPYGLTLFTYCRNNYIEAHLYNISRIAFFIDNHTTYTFPLPHESVNNHIVLNIQNSGTEGGGYYNAVIASNNFANIFEITCADSGSGGVRVESVPGYPSRSNTFIINTKNSQFESLRVVRGDFNIFTVNSYGDGLAGAQGSYYAVDIAGNYNKIGAAIYDGHVPWQVRPITIRSGAIGNEILYNVTDSPASIDDTGTQTIIR